MTEVEQELYALMGISPLVRLEREFKDPKSVVIYVKAPGENDPTEETGEKIESSSDELGATTLGTPVLEATPVEEFSELELPVVPEAEVEDSNSTSESEEATNGRRRRRRRSSAQKEVTV